MVPLGGLSTVTFFPMLDGAKSLFAEAELDSLYSGIAWQQVDGPAATSKQHD